MEGKANLRGPLQSLGTHTRKLPTLSPYPGPRSGQSILKMWCRVIYCMTRDKKWRVLGLLSWAGRGAGSSRRQLTPDSVSAVVLVKE